MVKSAGLLMYKFENGELKVLLGHPGGPFFNKKDEGVWSIPKGMIEENEDPLEAAKREFEEEVGRAPKGKFIPLDSIKQKSGKVVWVWAFEGNMEKFEPKSFFDMEWPPRSGKKQSFPEMDKAELFSIEDARKKIMPAQMEFVERLKTTLKLS